MANDRPDVLVIVMDCVRRDLFQEALAAGVLPALARARAEFVDYSRAVAPGSWTIPSHASLFTGVYPWDHNAHYKGGAILGPTPPTLAEWLRGRGYRTVSLSANGYIQPGTGLTRGFERALWGGDREFFLRAFTDSASCPALNGADAAVHALLGQPSHASPLRVGAMRALSRFTAMCDALNRLGGQVRGTSPARVGAWIEQEFDRELTEHRDQPLFAFVNLLEAHEPYLANAGQPIGVADWLSYATATQVSELWTSGERAPSSRDLEWARRGYRASLPVIDGRVGALFDRLRAHDRWSNALVVVTSDHGQSFGEGGFVYHRLTLEESITRIPLWAKWPGATAAAAPTTVDRWVSLIDVPATVVAHVEPGARFGDADGVALDAREPSPERTVYAMTDGLAPPEAERFSEVRRAEVDRVQIAGYYGMYKTIVDQTGTEQRFRVGPGAATPVGADDRGFNSAAFGGIPARLRTILSLPEPTTVSERIAGWGY